MKAIFFVLMSVLFVSCGGSVGGKFTTNTIQKVENVKVDVFSLTFHKQLGSCTSLPISHRMLLFSGFVVTGSAADFFIGSLEIVLDENSKTYQALYSEYPGPMNIDQNIFKTTLNGNFSIEKAASDSENDKLILENIGVVVPTIKNSRVDFIITFDGNINRPLTQNENDGRTVFTTTSLIDDNCLF